MKPLADAWHRAWQKPDNSEIYEWAKSITLAGSYKPKGPFDITTTRHAIAPLEALKAPQIRVVNLVKATQTFGTGIVDLWCYHTIANAPSAFQFNWSSDQLGKDHAESRITPTIEANEILFRNISENRHRMRTQEIQLRNGEWVYVRGGTERNLQAKSIGKQGNDEIWQWAPGRLAEADARLSQYERDGTSKQCNVGQGSRCVRDEDGNPVGDDWFMRSQVGASVFVWNVPCEKCGVFFVPRMEDRADGGRHFIFQWDADGSNIRCVCRACGAEMVDTDSLKAFWNAKGKYVLQSDGVTEWRKDFQSERVTFNWNAFIWLRWKMLVEEYRQASVALKSHITIPLEKFIQKRLGEFFDDRKHVSIVPVELRVEEFGTGDWPDEVIRFMTVDCQHTLTTFYVTIFAWSRLSAMRRLYRGVVHSWEEVREVQARFKVRCNHVGVDAGYKQTDVVRECAKHIEDNCETGWIALKGEQLTTRTQFFINESQNGKKTQSIYRETVSPELYIGVNGHKASEWESSLSTRSKWLRERGRLKVRMFQWSNYPVYEMMEKYIAGNSAGFSVPKEEENEPLEIVFRQHLAAKKRVIDLDKKTGAKRVTWKNIPPSADDHFWDCMAMQFPLASMAKILVGV